MPLLLIVILAALITIIFQLEAIRKLLMRTGKASDDHPRT
jgi:hypothetical protein